MALAPYSMIIKGSVEKVKAICQKYGVEIIQSDFFKDRGYTFKIEEE